MLVSTKGRYALRVMLDLAEHNTGENIKLVDISKRQEISEKYLESIAKVLSKKGLIYAQRGKGGGYKLNYSPENYTVLQILDAVEEDTAPIECLGKCSITCKRMPFCKTYPMRISSLT